MHKALKIYFSHLPNWIYFALLAVGLSYIMITGAFGQYWYLSVLLLALVPFIEYFTHKYVLHLPRPTDPEKHPHWEWFAKRIHYLHHEDPKKLEHIFAEWWLTLPMLGVYVSLSWLLTHNWQMVAVFNTTLVAYFLVYEWTHFMAHYDGYTPKSKYARFLKKFHLWHHYKNEDYWYGITSPVADWVFGKWKDPHQVQPSQLALKNRGRL